MARADDSSGASSHAIDSLVEAASVGLTAPSCNGELNDPGFAYDQEVEVCIREFVERTALGTEEKARLKRFFDSEVKSMTENVLIRPCFFAEVLVGEELRWVVVVNWEYRQTNSRSLAELPLGHVFVFVADPQTREVLYSWHCG